VDLPEEGHEEGHNNNIAAKTRTKNNLQCYIGALKLKSH